jgi:hypothetical protein
MIRKPKAGFGGAAPEKNPLPLYSSGRVAILVEALVNDLED